MLSRKMFVTVKRDNWKRARVECIMGDMTMSQLIDIMLDERYREVR